MKLYMACEGGGTRSVAGLYDAGGALLREAEAGPCNPAAYGLEASARALAALGQALMVKGTPDVELLAGVAGAANPAWREALGQMACAELGLSAARITTDVHPLLLANANGRPAVLAVAGTGACVLACDAGGQLTRAGGRGTLLGDDGSAWRIAAQALRAAAHAIDGTGPETPLTESLPKAAGLDQFEELVEWGARAGKREVADLARAVFDAAAQGDAVARQSVENEAGALAALVLAVARRMPGAEETAVFVSGGVFANAPMYRTAFDAALAAAPRLRPQTPPLQGHRAVFALSRLTGAPPWLNVVAAQGTPKDSRPATERTHAGAQPLDRLSALEIVRQMNRLDRDLADVVTRHETAIAACIEAATESLRSGGRILYIGAGTSGRLGVLDASECPPTFGVSPERVVGIIAGGDKALRNSVEGAEDNTAQAAADIEALQLTARDLAVGISASGAAPYVIAALETAKKNGAKTVLLCCNPAHADAADLTIALDTGPEALPGSTRLKAGTATKIVLNMISTGAMARAGNVYQGLMVGMKPVNAKLWRRATHIVADIGNVTEARARGLLAHAEGDIRKAAIMARRGVDGATAAAMLAAAGGLLGRVLDDAPRQGK
jgi:N-acetylmuramic acid 6-phosphate etherase